MNIIDLVESGIGVDSFHKIYRFVISVFHNEPLVFSNLSILTKQILEVYNQI